MAREYIVKILSWKKYQNREVKTKSSWLRLQNDFIENPNFAEFTSDERIVWIHLLCCASKLNQDSLQVPHQCSHRVLNRCTGIDENAFHQAIKKLKQLRIVEVRTTRGRHADDTFANADDTQPRHYEDETLRNVTKTRRNEDETGRDEVNLAPQSPTADADAITVVVPEPRPVAKTTPVWEAYRDAYVSRYHTEPIRNHEFNIAASNLIKKLGAEKAPLIAKFYVSHNDWFYAKNGHPLPLAVKDAQKLHTEFQTGQRITTTQARQAEQTDFYQDQMRRIASGEL